VQLIKSYKLIINLFFRFVNDHLIKIAKRNNEFLCYIKAFVIVNNNNNNCYITKLSKLLLMCYISNIV